MTLREALCLTYQGDTVPCATACLHCDGMTKAAEKFFESKIAEAFMDGLVRGTVLCGLEAGAKRLEDEGHLEAAMRVRELKTL